MLETAYLHLLQRILDTGEPRTDRTGVGTRSLFAETLDADVSQEFPLLTTKRIHWKSVLGELLWMLRGDTNVQWLNDHGINIWNQWSNENGDLGPVYGQQLTAWRDYDGGTINQLEKVRDQIINDPMSRRHVVSMWNVADLPRMALEPCHLLHQYYVRGGEFLDMQMYQRSADVFLGVPFNIASYAALLHIMAAFTGLQPGRLRIVFGDVHIYNTHVEQVQEQLSRPPHPPPTLRVDVTGQTWDTLDFQHFTLAGYRAHPAIAAPVAV